jgi:carbon storage regulator
MALLTLTRRRGERIWLGPDYWVTVVEVGPDWVRLGVEAPREVPVDRAEVRARKLAEAAKGGAP